jgi:hypothetical protein
VAGSAEAGELLWRSDGDAAMLAAFVESARAGG